MRTTRPLTVLLLGLALAGAPAGAAIADPPGTASTVTITGVSSPTFFPVDDGYQDLTRVAYDSDVPGVDLVVTVTDSDDHEVRTDTGSVDASGHGSWAWDGRDDASLLQPAGDYTVTVSDASDTTSSDSTTVTLDRARLVTRTFRKEVKATRSTIDRQVGRCSTLRRPAARGWSGSLGYYANTRCRHSGRPSVVATVNGVLVPQALRDPDYGSFYRGVVVKTYAGAARNRGRSKAVLQYWNRRDDQWFAIERMPSALGTHAGRRAPSAPMIFANHGNPYLLWSLFTANGNRYDVKSFTVVLKYQVLQESGMTPVRPAALAGRLDVPHAPTVR